MGERFFRDITTNAMRRGVFTSVHDLIDAHRPLPHRAYRDPKPFIWTASVRDILAKVVRARAALQAQVARLEGANS
jgi:hypothetical protein